MPGSIFTILLLVAYLLGAIPFGLLIARARGIDIRKQGSGNIGATNVGRVLGRKWGYACLALDILKGFVPTFAANFIVHKNPGETPNSLALLQWLAIAVAAVIGHIFPIWLRFRGGKGVATTVGVALGIFPYFTVPMIIALAAYAAVRFGTGFVSAGSLAIAVVFPVVFALYIYFTKLSMTDFWPLQIVSILLGVLIIIRHRSNIARLVRGQETKIGGTETESSGD